MGAMIHIAYTKTHDRWIHRAYCPDCKRHTFIVGFYENWYGISETCLRCGRRWEGKEWMPLPFSRYARRDSIMAAKRRWRRGLDPTPSERTRDE